LYKLNGSQYGRAVYPVQNDLHINKGCVTWVVFVFTALGIVLDPFALHATASCSGDLR